MFEAESERITVAETQLPTTEDGYEVIGVPSHDGDHEGIQLFISNTDSGNFTVTPVESPDSTDDHYDVIGPAAVAAFDQPQTKSDDAQNSADHVDMKEFDAEDNCQDAVS